MKQRCSWVNNNPIMVAYHDTEWGLPQFNDKVLFEYLILDAFQAGLSWEIIINKRQGFKKAFCNFDPKKIKQFTQKDVDRLLQDASIVRNRLKIEATIVNAEKYFELVKEFGSLSNYLWSFVNNKPIQNKFKNLKELPAKTALSDTISKDMKKRGFKFVGSTCIYAFMQGMGMVNDHTTDCFRYKEVQK